MYPKGDPRNGLTIAARDPLGSSATPASYGLYYKDKPTDDDANGKAWYTRGQDLLIVPPGDSSVTLPKGGRVARLFSIPSDDFNAKCADAAAYSESDPNIPLFQRWPDPIAEARSATIIPARSFTRPKACTRRITAWRPSSRRGGLTFRCCLMAGSRMRMNIRCPKA